MPKLATEWAEAYATQARSDRTAYEALCNTPGLHACHRLHYLQMFMEKLAKAHLWRGQPEDEKPSPRWARQHRVIEKVIPTLVRSYWTHAGMAGEPRDQQMEAFRSICRKLDQLAPAVDDDGRAPSNSEYPWADLDADGRSVVRIPATTSFKVADDIVRGYGKSLLKVAFKVADDL